MMKQDDDNDENDRVTRSLAGLAIIVFLAVVALYLVQQMEERSKVEDCFMSGRTNCAPIDRSEQR